MRHPTEGTLRQLVDEPAGVADADREHVAGCAQCLDGLAAAREDSQLVAAALATDVDVDVDAAWRRLNAASADTAHAAPPRRRFRALRRRPAVAALAVALVVGGAGTAAASGWLDIFQTEEVAPVTLNAADLAAVPDLEAYGDVRITREADVHEVPDASAAAAETGLDVPEVASLPKGVSGEPVVQVGGEASATFTFDADRAAPSGAVPPPPDGSRVRLVAGPGVLQTWPRHALVVGRAVAPTAFASGVSFDTMRDYLLSLPGLPEHVASQLRTFNADGSTLPIPVPGRHFTTSQEQVGGAPATVLAARDETMAAVVWVEDGVATVVAGSLGADEVLAVARELR